MRIASGGLAVALLLSACGDRFTPPAAVVGSSRISNGSVRHELDQLLLDPQLRQQVAGTAGEKARKDLTRRLLAFLIELRMVERYARGHQISVTPEEVEKGIQDSIASVGGQAQFEQELKARGLTVGVLRRNIRRQILINKVADSIAARAGVPASAPQEDKGRAFERWLIQEYRSTDIEVNPRYGRLDPRSGQIVPITSTAE